MAETARATSDDLLTCESCHAYYNVERTADEAHARMRCTSCGHSRDVLLSGARTGKWTLVDPDGNVQTFAAWDDLVRATPTVAGPEPEPPAAHDRRSMSGSALLDITPTPVAPKLALVESTPSLPAVEEAAPPPRKEPSSVDIPISEQQLLAAAESNADQLVAALVEAMPNASSDLTPAAPAVAQNAPEPKKEHEEDAEVLSLRDLQVVSESRQQVASEPPQAVSESRLPTPPPPRAGTLGTLPPPRADAPPPPTITVEEPAQAKELEPDLESLPDSLLESVRDLPQSDPAVLESEVESVPPSAPEPEAKASGAKTSESKAKAAPVVEAKAEEKKAEFDEPKKTKKPEKAEKPGTTEKTKKEPSRSAKPARAPKDDEQEKKKEKESSRPAAATAAPEEEGRRGWLLPAAGVAAAAAIVWWIASPPSSTATTASAPSTASTAAATTTTAPTNTPVAPADTQAATAPTAPQPATAANAPTTPVVAKEATSQVAAATPPATSADKSKSSGTDAKKKPYDNLTLSDALDKAGAAKRSGDYAAARELYARVLRESPSNVEAHGGLGDIARAQGDLAGAKASYQRALAASPDYGPAQLGLADTLWDSGDRAGAQQYYAAIVRRQGAKAPDRAKTRSAGVY